jgi:hypothetical protein
VRLTRSAELSAPAMIATGSLVLSLNALNPRPIDMRRMRLGVRVEW